MIVSPYIMYANADHVHRYGLPVSSSRGFTRWPSSRASK